jgi:hypothetical protein
MIIKATKLRCGLATVIHAGVSGRANVNSIRKARGVPSAEAASCDLNGYNDVSYKLKSWPKEYFPFIPWNVASIC